MAPGRKRGAKGVGGPGGGGGLRLGDLVLAKVKGFPAWPAKISRPEDWERVPDPKKYFVQFFGTEEIAFVAPADIQAFTIEAKNKLSARCRGKTVKYFAQAVREICEEFDQSQQKSSSFIRDDGNQSAPGSDTHITDGAIDDVDVVETDSKDGNGNGVRQKIETRNLGDHSSGLGRCSKRQGDADHKSTKTCASGGSNGGSSMRNKLSADDALLREESSTSSSNSESGSSFDRMEESSSRKMNHISKGSDNSRLLALADDSAALLPLDSQVCPDDSKDLVNGHRQMLDTGLKRKGDSSFQKHNIDGTAGPTVGVNNSSSSMDLSVSNQKSKIQKKNTSRVKDSSQTDGGKKGNKLFKDKKNFEEKVKPHLGVEESIAKDKAGLSGKRQGHGKQQNNEVSDPAKRSKPVDVTDGAKGLLQTTRNMNSQSQDDRLGSTEVDRSMLRGKAENRFSAKSLSTAVDSNFSGDEDVLPPTKRRRRAFEAMCTSSALSSENRTGRSSAPVKNDSRRRAVRLFDDDQEEEPKTPIHGSSTKRVVVTSHDQVFSKKGDSHGSASNQLGKQSTGTPESKPSKKLVSSGDKQVEYLSPNSQQMEKGHGKPVASHLSPEKVDTEKVFSKEGKQTTVSPGSSSLSVPTKLPVEPQKPNKLLDKISGNISQRKTPSSHKDSVTISDSFTASVSQLYERSKLDTPTEMTKGTSKPHSKTSDLANTLVESHSLQLERSESGREEKLNSSDQRASDSSTSMRHLIAAAQAKRRQAHLHNFNGHSDLFVVANTDLQVRSPSPAPVTQPMGSSNMAPLDKQGFLPNSSLTSPRSDVYPNSSINPHGIDEFVERRVSSGHQTVGGSLSGGTEAAVARDAFEGMIETLSRTKESIGRATRLAIDCAKYGIANEVVELLIRKLEIEPSFHRKVDLFFLVDSITQCSHSHKGIAGASYIPAVQAALPRLLLVAAPPGPGARENRRQCLKVLRLWLERKILPEHILRRYMDDIGAANDDTSSGFSLRRPSRAERAIDDPIREMEGMLVDEYGSNATFQLPGVFSPHIFEEDEEEEEVGIPNFTMKEVTALSPSEHSPAAGDLENNAVTPSERRHHILEDVDGELEMEDVSGHQKDERPSMTGDANVIEASQSDSVNVLESASSIPCELPPLPEGSPPVPLDSPPPTPPLPSSLPSSPLPPLPPLSPGPLPPPPPLQPQQIPPLPIGPPPILPHKPSLPPQPSMVPQHPHSLPSSSLASSVGPYQQVPRPAEIGGNPTGNLTTATGNTTSHGPSVDASVRNEMYVQQASCFVPPGVGSAQEPSGYNSSRSLEYGHNNPYISSLASQPSVHFQPGNAPFAQRPLPPNPPQQNSSSHFSYPMPAVRHPPLVQHPSPAIQPPLPPVQHPPPPPYPPPYSHTKFADVPRQFVADEQWRMRPPNEYNPDHQRGMWMPGVRSSSGPGYAQEGYLMPHMERPSVGTANFRPSAPNSFSSVTPVPGHGVNHMIPGRPDMSAFNWRPA